MKGSLFFLLLALLMCGVLLHHITILAVRNEQKKNSFVSQYIFFSLITLWFTPLYISVKLAVFFGVGQYGLVLWLVLFIIGIVYVIKRTERERKALQQYHHRVGSA
ncbi:MULTISPECIES: hypothetical protein [Geobacillus]|uniref:hypothetical protein n=1 Tax=Geobacillus TaxID=129337 RepID=UPI0006E50A4B|nr:MULTISPECIES: hypothetical protein [Geobacillus]ATO38789.1 hypothetical protein GTID1_17380 [Geobacillus thermodenitrificans]KQB92958.1 hypothetical protein GEPA3_2080 [Geobacillus sp. PA-3]MED0662159.1 hypothetical protein [Geobacillus thermodenitrificans]NNU87561.1 hypothetical protein [Geobacillus sp. MR]PJW19617.1 hypothetical protein CV632_14690 [Geobacillus thermodenitrificans]